MVKAQTNVRNARAYFREHLTVGDYYCERQAVPGEWLGQGAGLLGLSGKVGEKAFLSLCNGRHPETGERLMQRLNSTRRERNRIAANRRVFFDFTISPPKSVSVLALCQDARIVELHNAAGRVCALSPPSAEFSRPTTANSWPLRGSGTLPTRWNEITYECDAIESVETPPVRTGAHPEADMLLEPVETVIGPTQV